MSRYASQTKVDPGRSRAEIEKLLMRFGAGQFGYMTDADNNRAHIMFIYNGLRIRVSVTLPDRGEFSTTRSGREKKETQIELDYAKEVRRRWRSLVLLVKAKLVAVEDLVATFEEEFLPYVLWANGRTTAEQLAGQIQEISMSDAPPNLLLPGPKG